MARARAREDGQRSPRAERPGGSVATLWPPQPANTEPSSTPWTVLAGQPGHHLTERPWAAGAAPPESCCRSPCSGPFYDRSSESENLPIS